MAQAPMGVPARSARSTPQARLVDDATVTTIGSPRADPRTRLNVICPYYTMFPLAFPFEALRAGEPSQWVLDPFCGRGTTLYAARLRGMPSVGVDADAVAVAVARAKVSTSSADDVRSRCDEILNAEAKVEMPRGTFWSMAYHTDTLRDVCRLRQGLADAPPGPTDDILRALVLGVLHGPLSRGEPAYLSNQMPRTYATKPHPAVTFWRNRGLVAPRVDVRAVIGRRAEYLLEEVPPGASGAVYEADSRSLASLPIAQRFSWVITSPPYFGMRTYRPDQWLRHWFVGGSADVDYAATGMLPASDHEAFVDALAQVWSSVAAVCRPGARLIVRFGALPSVPSRPADILEQSLLRSKAGWNVREIAPAGTATQGRRQARQMRRGGEPVPEIDLHAQLTT